jgi:hypothetical protein
VNASRLAAVLSITALFGSSLVFSGCVTRPKTYHAPDATKFKESAKKLEVNIEKTGATIDRAQLRVAAAQKDFDEVSSASIEVRDRVVELSKIAPPELLPKFEELLAIVDEKTKKEGELSQNLEGAYSEIEQAKKDNNVSETLRTSVLSDFEVYQRGAIKNAADATNERNARIVAEKQVLREKIFRWIWRIGGGVVLLALVGVFILWIAGKWTFKGSIAAAKVYLGR